MTAERIVYIALVNDRHADPELTAWSTPEAAITYAKRSLARIARHYPQDIEETAIPGWLYHATYGIEGDYVRVEAVEVQS